MAQTSGTVTPAHPGARPAGIGTALAPGGASGPAPGTVVPTPPGARPVLSASVVVCAYTLDRWALLVAAVRAAAVQRPAPTEIVLVVDHNPALAARARHELAAAGAGAAPMAGDEVGVRAAAEAGAGAGIGARAGAGTEAGGRARADATTGTGATARAGFRAAAGIEAAARADAGAGVRVEVVENRYGRGLSGARNSGIEATGGDVVVFLDDDALPAEGWLAALLAPFADPAVLATGGSARPIWSDGRPGWFPEEFDWVVGCSYRGQSGTRAEVRNPLGCNMAFRRSVFAGVEGFRDGIGRIGRRPLGCEETELCIRLRQRWPGGRVLLVPEAVVDHHVPPDRHAFAYFRRRCFAEGISKAAVAHRVGAADALSSERAYVTRTLPRGILTELGRSLRTRHTDGPRRAAAIVAGCTITVAGYLWGRLMVRRRLVVRRRLSPARFAARRGPAPRHRTRSASPSSSLLASAPAGTALTQPASRDTSRGEA